MMNEKIEIFFSTLKCEFQNINSEIELQQFLHFEDLLIPRLIVFTVFRRSWIFFIWYRDHFWLFILWFWTQKGNNFFSCTFCIARTLETFYFVLSRWKEYFRLIFYSNTWHYFNVLYFEIVYFILELKVWYVWN